MKRKRKSKTTSAPRSTGDQASIDEAYALALSMLASRPDVTGIDIGPKYVDGDKKDRLAIRVHVREKLSGRRLRSSERIPREILGVETDVLVARYRKHGAPAGAYRFDPIQPGVSIGNPKAEAGTLGLIVYDNDSGAPCLLGSFHVLAGPDALEGDPITQPSRLDGGAASGDTVATLYRYFAPGPWGDAALARLTKDRRFEPAILTSGVCISAIGIPTTDMLVEKSGRTTGVTRGRIEAFGTYFYPEVASGVSGFRVVSGDSSAELCAPGDSGCVYYAPGTSTGVGLHCAGGFDPAVGEVGIGCSLARVAATLGFSVRPIRK